MAWSETDVGEESAAGGTCVVVLCLTVPEIGVEVKSL